jgi:hypothetical protein
MVSFQIRMLCNRLFLSIKTIDETNIILETLKFIVLNQNKKKFITGRKINCFWTRHCLCSDLCLTTKLKSSRNNIYI